MSKENKQGRRSHFIAVDLYQTSYSPISVKAIFEIYSRKFNVPIKETHKISFRDCVEKLRELEKESS